jgi:hypothetical protein
MFIQSLLEQGLVVPHRNRENSFCMQLLAFQKSLNKVNYSDNLDQIYFASTGISFSVVIILKTIARLKVSTSNSGGNFKLLPELKATKFICSPI